MGKSSPAGSRGGSVAERPLRILQVGPADLAGGAERVAWNLFLAYRACGHLSWLAVGRKRSPDPDVLRIPDPDGGWFQFWQRAHSRLQPLEASAQGARLLSRLARRLAEPGRFLDERLGRESFRFPGSRALLRFAPQRPDVVHCHNLHDAYFDLRTLPWLSQQLAVVLTLHDAWLLSGHCAHSFGCERWKTGCGRCPDLSIYPAIRRDATAFNWRRKQRIYAKGRFYVTTPCHWLMDRVKQSVLAPSILGSAVIPNGVDLSVFRPGDRQRARATLSIPSDLPVLLFVAHRIRRNPWKDYLTLRGAVARVAAPPMARRILLLAVGEDGPSESLGAAEVQFLPFQDDPEAMARYYQAADLYVHAARVDSFPTTVLEALACGLPVVATAVGGIPEQVKSLDGLPGGMAGPAYGPEEATGVLVPPGDTEAMAAAVGALLADAPLRIRLGANAAADTARRFGLDRQVGDYLAFYRRILAGRDEDCEPTGAVA